MSGDDRWQSLIDRELQKMLENTEDLPGQGKPLKLDSDASAPDDMRMAYKIMKDNDVVPGWIALGKALEKDKARLQQRIQRAVQQYHTQMSKADNDPLRDRINAQWQAQQRELQATVDDYNNKILTYNLKIPAGINQRHLLDLQREIQGAG